MNPNRFFKIFELSSAVGARVSHQTQKWIRKNFPKHLKQTESLAAARGPALASARKIFTSRKSIRYEVQRMHRFSLFDYLFGPSYDQHRDYFPNDGHPFTAHIQMLRALDFMEGLPENNAFAYQRVGAVFKNIRDTEKPEQVMVLRLATLLSHIVIQQCASAVATGDSPHLWNEMERSVAAILEGSGFLQEGG